MDYKQGLLKNSRLTETQLLKLTKAVLLSAQQDLSATGGSTFHILEGTVTIQDDGKFIFTPNKFFKRLIDECEYPSVLKIEEMKLLNWIIAIMEGDDD